MSKETESWVAMQFRGTPVWVRADGEGSPVVVGGRVEMRYRSDGGKVYRGSLRNLTPVDNRASPPPEVRESEPPVVTEARLEPPPALRPVPVQGEKVLVYADGACSGNPGLAGLGVHFEVASRTVEYMEPLGQSTNNVAELMAILRTLQLCEGRAESLVVRTDSRYAIGVLSEPWKPKKNRALIAAIKEAMTAQPIDFQHVAGHAGEPGNERADYLARTAVQIETPALTVAAALDVQPPTSQRRTKR